MALLSYIKEVQRYLKEFHPNEEPDLMDDYFWYGDFSVDDFIDDNNVEYNGFQWYYKDEDDDYDDDDETDEYQYYHYNDGTWGTVIFMKVEQIFLQLYQKWKENITQRTFFMIYFIMEYKI